MDPDQSSKFAIHEAAREGRTAAVESFLNANSRLATTRDDDDRLPIHWATSYNHLPIVELLVSRKDFDPDVKDGSGWTPLMIASSLREGDDIVDLLLAKGADISSKNHSGQTSLHFCASKNNLSTARKLLSHGASARIMDRRRQLPLHRAAAIGSVPFLNLLLEHKSPINTSDIAGFTALHHVPLNTENLLLKNECLAISEGHGDAALVLLKAGAETDKRDIDEHLAIELAPDTKIRKFILQAAEREGIDIVLETASVNPPPKT